MHTSIRVVLAGFLAGFVLFFWGFAVHMLTPIGSMGMQSLANEEAMKTFIKGSVSEPGFYIFPAPNLDGSKSGEEMKVREEQVKTGASGILVVQPNGARFMLPQQLGFEFASNVAACLVAALLLSQTKLPYPGRVLFVGALGLFGWLAVCASHWTWYAFPTETTIAALIDEVGGFLTAGMVLGLIIKPKPTV